MTNNTLATHFPADMWTYKGWTISYDLKPIPSRAFDWEATSPNYDCDYSDETGFERCSGAHVTAATYEELLMEIEGAIIDLENEGEIS